MLKAGEVSVGAEAVDIPVGRPAGPQRRAASPEGDPEIRLDRAPDGTIRRIEVRCPCGRITTLRCEYAQEQGGSHELPVT